MATYPFTYADLKASINSRIHNKIGLVATPRIIINDVVNEVSDLGLRTSKRQAVLAPNLFNDIYQYTAPSDIDGSMLVGIQSQSMDRSRNNIWELVTEEEFDIRKQTDYNLVAFADHTFVRTLKISSYNDNLRELAIASLQAVTGDGSGSWVAVGTATNIVADNYNFIKGNGSVQFDYSSGTAAGIKNSALSTFDLTYYLSAGSVFLWVYLPTVTSLTNVVLNLGSSASNYYAMTATTPNDGASFVAGWNLVRFDFNTKTTTGTPTVTACVYASLTINFSVAPATTGFRFNWLNAKQGQISNLVYYSKYPWQSVAGTLMFDSTADTDYMVADQDEYILMVEKGVEVLGMAAREYTDSKLAAERYKRMAEDYKKTYPTENLQLTSTYYYIQSRGVNRTNTNMRLP